MIYHITTKPAWKEAQEKRVYIPATFEQDEFIHCSDHYQVESTANRFYADVPDLIVLEIDPDKLEAELVYENLEGGAMLFPHLYGFLNLDAVVSSFEFVRKADGRLFLPPGQEHPEPTLFSELPFGTAGKIFRSPTPGSRMFDPDDKVLSFYLENKIDTVVVLNSEEEHTHHSGRNLLERYQQAGLRVIYAPVADFSTPPNGYWDETVEQAAEAAKKGENLAIHCHAGVGRTGMFAAMMAHQLLDLNADEAIDWVRQYIPYAIDTEHQKVFVREYCSQNSSK